MTWILIIEDDITRNSDFCLFYCMRTSMIYVCTNFFFSFFLVSMITHLCVQIDHIHNLCSHNLLFFLCLCLYNVYNDTCAYKWIIYICVCARARKRMQVCR